MPTPPNSFNGFAFDITLDGYQVIDEEDYAEIHIPGGSTTYVDDAGPKATHVQCVAFLPDQSSYNTLRGYRGAVATLVTAIDGSFTAKLVKCDKSKQYPGQQCEVQLEFIVS